MTSHLDLSALVTCHTLYFVLTTWQSAVFLLNSRQTHFTVTRRNGYPFSRSYGAILPSSLEWFLPRALEYSSHLPVSVYGTGAWGNDAELFSAVLPVVRFNKKSKHRSFDDLATFQPASLDACAPASAGIFACCASTTPSGLALAPD